MRGTSFVIEGAAEIEFAADRAVAITKSHLRAFPPEKIQASFQILDMMRIKAMNKLKGITKASR